MAPCAVSLAWSAVPLTALCLLLSGCGGGSSGGGGGGDTDVGEPLVITDMLKAQNITKAQQLTRVDLSTWGWNSKAAMHSGFMALDALGSASERQTFFWYSAAQNGDANAPVLLWLQGGPGASSLFGMFTEIGPFGIKKGAVQTRAINWNEKYHLLFLDNPVGTGFSYTNHEDGYVQTHEQAGEDLCNAISQFFQLFPHLRANDFYITGESYAGKWVPAAAYNVDLFNQGKGSKDLINLKGISIGDGAMDPVTQFKGFGQLLWHMGMVDESERDQFKVYEDKIQQQLQQGKDSDAFATFDEMLNGDFFPYPTYYANVTGMTTNYFNFQEAPDATPLGGDFVAWLKTPEVRKAIHVGGRSYAAENQTVESYLKSAWMQSITEMLIPLMEKYKVLIYSGQNDVILGPPLTENFLYQLPWTGQAAYKSAKKTVWRRSALGPGSQLPDVAGYVRQVGSFTQAVVRGAGHLVPGDQPERALDMMQHFISGTTFEPNSTTAAILDHDSHHSVIV